MQTEKAEYRISGGIMERTPMRSVSKIVDLKNKGKGFCEKYRFSAKAWRSQMEIFV
jgi:hypothetical protein